MYPFTGTNTLWTLPGMLIVALALSIGWGIRGNYGHELGAMLPGALAAIAACVLSGREDWRRRVLYFGLFGAIGWGFGGSISYMQVIGYTHSGHEETQLYGFYNLFAIGFLWAAVGGAATALPACLEYRRLVDLVASFVPLFLIWVGLYLVEHEIITPSDIVAKAKTWITPSAEVTEEPLAEPGHPDDLLAPGRERSMNHRHEDLFYWLDSDWMTVAIILSGIFLFELIRSRFRSLPGLALFAGIGSILGVGVQYALAKTGQTDRLLELIVKPQGDPSRFPIEQLPTNWPALFSLAPNYLGWGAGLVLGVVAYFLFFGRFSRGMPLYLYMAVGWFVGFVGLAVLGDLHMTPPRGDSWAGIAGMLLGGWLYFIRAGWFGPLTVSVVCGTIGGVGFAGAVWFKLMCVSQGNPNLIADPEVVEAWRHFQSANWHSVVEQSYGFINGIGVALALGILATRWPTLDDDVPRQRWAEVFCLAFVLPVLAYANLAKNLNEYLDKYPAGGGQYQPVPDKMRAPLFSWIELTAWQWYTLLFGIVSLGIILAVSLAGKKKLAILPESWLGRGQLLFVILLWVFVVGNFVKALPAFSEQRFITEGVILVNAVIVTVLLLFVSPSSDLLVMEGKFRGDAWIAGAILFTAIVAGGLPWLLHKHVREVYGDKSAGHAGPNIRFGENANWRINPNLIGVPHR